MRATTLLLSVAGAITMMISSAAADTFRIEIDYMVDNSVSGGHSHQPTQAEVDAVVQMFACQGHTLIIDVDDALTHYDVLQLDPDDPNNFFGYDGVNNSFKSIKDANFDRDGIGGWHYAIFGHRYEWRPDADSSESEYFNSRSSGLGESSGDDFVVTLGTFTGETGTPFDKASTLAHEFGHNLGLSHCGVSDCTDIGANPPNLPSIMSYNYQLEGVRSGLLCNQLIPETAEDLFKELDYSSGRMCSLNENSLDEPLGTTFRAVDWDCMNGIQGTVTQDLSTDGPTWCNNSGSIETLADYDEWANIASAAKTKTAEELMKVPVISCITSDEVAALREKADCANPGLVTESCINRDVLYVSGSGNSFASGACSDPIGAVGAAVSTARPYSAVVLKPQIYNESGTGSLILSNPVRIYAAKSALIR